MTAAPTQFTPAANGSTPDNPIRGWTALRETWEFGRDPLATITRWARTYGDTAFFQVGNFKYGLLNDPTDIANVLAANNLTCKDISYRVLKPIFGDGLLLSERDTWQRHRRLMQPAFSSDRVTQYATTTVEACDRMLRTWSAGEQRDLYADMSQLTVNVVTQTLFGVGVEDTALEIGAAVDAIMQQYVHRSETFFLLPAWLPTPSNRKARRATRRLNDIVTDIIAQRKQSPGQDLLSMLIQARDEDGSRFSDRELRDQVLTLLLAGHDTTANALTWTLVLLAHNPSVEAKLHAELDREVGNRLPKQSDISQLPYTEAVLKESMRLYPPAWALGRELTQDSQIGRHQLSRGTVLYMCEWVVHKDARWFPDPDRFVPERWQGDFERSLPRCAYFPFGAGPRVCIGKSFAMMEATLILAAIAWQFKLSLVNPDDIALRPSITLPPQSKVTVSVPSS